MTARQSPIRVSFRALRWPNTYQITQTYMFLGTKSRDMVRGVAGATDQETKLDELVHNYPLLSSLVFVTVASFIGLGFFELVGFLFG